jgi:hypothetical protein
VSLDCKVLPICRLPSLTWEFGFLCHSLMGECRMSLWSTIVVSVPAHGSGGVGCALWLYGWQAHMTHGPRLLREHRTADRVPGRLHCRRREPCIKMISYL